MSRWRGARTRFRDWEFNPHPEERARVRVGRAAARPSRTTHSKGHASRRMRRGNELRGLMVRDAPSVLLTMRVNTSKAGKYDARSETRLRSAFQYHPLQSCRAR